MRCMVILATRFCKFVTYYAYSIVRWDFLPGLFLVTSQGQLTRMLAQLTACSRRILQNFQPFVFIISPCCKDRGSFPMVNRQLTLRTTSSINFTLTGSILVVFNINSSLLWFQFEKGNGHKACDVWICDLHLHVFRIFVSESKKKVVAIIRKNHVENVILVFFIVCSNLQIQPN